MTRAEELRLAANLLEQADRATSQREKEACSRQAFLIIAQTFNTMLQMGTDHGLALAAATIAARRSNGGRA